MTIQTVYIGIAISLVLALIGVGIYNCSLEKIASEENKEPEDFVLIDIDDMKVIYHDYSKKTPWFFRKSED